MSTKGLCFLSLVSLVFVMGLVMVFNTTSAEILDGALEKSLHHALIRQVLYALVGILCAIGVWFVGHQTLLKLSGPLLLFSTILLALALLPGVGVQINGARRWIHVFGNSFQPSEFVKYLLPLYCIYRLSLQKTAITSKDFIRLTALLCIPIALILVEPDNGTVFIIGVTLIVLCLLARIPLAFWLWPLLGCVIVGGAVASRMPHVSDRIQVFLHPELDLLGKGHQPYQAKIAAGSGQILGKGFGESVQKMSYLPEARSDYIAAIFAEEFGFIGITVLIFVYVGIGFLGFLMAMSCQEESSFLLISVFVFLLCFQVFLNLGVVSGLLPSKGTSLPFLSQGGSSLLASVLAVSIIVHVHESSVSKPRVLCG